MWGHWPDPDRCLWVGSLDKSKVPLGARLEHDDLGESLIHNRVYTSRSELSFREPPHSQRKGAFCSFCRDINASDKTLLYPAAL